MIEMEYAPDRLFRAFTTGGGAPVDDGRLCARTLTFSSRWSGFLHPEDRLIDGNRSFSYLMMEPMDLEPGERDDLLVITHGLNEGSYAKLFPWGYNLALGLRRPVVIFSMAFHISRRTEQWGFSAQARLTAERNLVSGNRKVSPFNARISARLSQAPDRFFRGGVQSYYDAIDLCDQIRAGNHPGLNAGARVDFLGYSAGGYLALALLMADAGGRFSDSRAALFASGASMDGMRPGSVFIMDTESTDRLTAYMERRRYPDIEVEAGLQPLLEEPAHWMETIFFHGPGLSERLRYLGPRLTGVAGPGDRVITEEGMRKNLYPVTINSLDLGIHEFPFNLPDPLIETYDRRQPETRALLNDIHHGHRIAERYRDTFDAFIRIVSGALSS